jgi:hypothetical protein
MKFKVLPRTGWIPRDAKGIVFLLTDGWDDWFKYNTMYNVLYCDEEGEQHRIGDVKIGEFRMAKDQRRPSIPEEFESLGDPFFLVGAGRQLLRET